VYPPVKVEEGEAHLGPLPPPPSKTAKFLAGLTELPLPISRLPGGTTSRGSGSAVSGTAAERTASQLLANGSSGSDLTARHLQGSRISIDRDHLLSLGDLTLPHPLPRRCRGGS